MTERLSWTVYAAVLLVSLCLLCHEIVFIRIFSCLQWHNLSALVITFALLGFGISGSVLSVAGERVLRNFDTVMFAASLLLPVSFLAGFIMSASVDLNPYEIGTETSQIFYGVIYITLMALPFFSGALLICMTFMKFSIPRTYFVNLFGSGMGALTAVLLLFMMHPVDAMTFIIGLSALSAVLLSVRCGRAAFVFSVLFLFAVLAITVNVMERPGLRAVSRYKAISGAMSLPGAGVRARAYSPLSVVHVVEAPGLRSAAGLSLVSPFQVPSQKAIFFDGSSPSAVVPYHAGESVPGYVKNLASFLPYMISDNGTVLIIGAGGGECILKALDCDFGQIDAVEVNRRVISIMRGELSEFSGNIYSDERVRVLNMDGRSFIRSANRKYDLIDLSLIDAYSASASGVYALNESYLYTVESFEEMLSRLSRNGILAVTRWIVTPARDNLKIFATAAKALNRFSGGAEQRIIAVRSLQTVTVMISPAPFSKERIFRVKEFCREKLFDTVYFPGIAEKDVNKNIVLDKPLYYSSMVSLLSKNADKFIEDYDFSIMPAEDNRPYFYNFFKPRVLSYIKEYGMSQFPVTEWGYLLFILILVPLVAVSILFILLPAAAARSGQGGGKPAVILYFGLTGTGYFFVEMPLIQKMTLFLSHPSYSLSVVIAGMLVFSGAGSWFSERAGRGKVLFPALFAAAVIVFYILFLDSVLFYFRSLPVLWRVPVVLALTGPAAFCMGMPFPLGLLALTKGVRASVPWAWSINGFFSVISITGAALCAIIFGYRAVLGTAAVCYVCAAFLYPKLKARE